VDDAIVVLENIVRRINEFGETPLVAAYRGTRQVGFAVVATTLVLIAVFIPITFLEGDVGRLFREFALTIAAAVLFSSLLALTLTPMLASKLIRMNLSACAAQKAHPMPIWSAIWTKLNAASSPIQRAKTASPQKSRGFLSALLDLAEIPTMAAL